MAYQRPTTQSVEAAETHDETSGLQDSEPLPLPHPRSQPQHQPQLLPPGSRQGLTAWLTVASLVEHTKVYTEIFDANGIHTLKDLYVMGSEWTDLLYQTWTDLLYHPKLPKERRDVLWVALRTLLHISQENNQDHHHSCVDDTVEYDDWFNNLVRHDGGMKLEHRRAIENAVTEADRAVRKAQQLVRKTEERKQTARADRFATEGCSRGGFHSR